jgi:hypothetical protein
LVDVDAVPAIAPPPFLKKPSQQLLLLAGRT